FNDTALSYPKDKTIVELFEEQVENAPDKIAVICDEQKLTYAELNEKANQLAHRLRSMGIKQDEFVAILTGRRTETVTGIFAVLKSGGAYVPVDPGYPSERIEYMLSDSKPKCILTVGASLPFETEIPVIDIADNSIYTGNAENPERINKPTDLAYVIYTSGTTGKPKGVMVEHHGVVNLKQYFVNAYDITPDDVVLQFANFVFDASVWELNMALLNGATCAISTNNTDIAELERFFKNTGITVATLPPNFFIQTNLDKMRLLITAGSASSKEIVKKCDGFRYVNAYGPTETTVCATHWEYEGGAVPNNVPIGKPISNFQVYILDGTNLCGIGIPGELCVAGAGIARGYLNRPELTAEKFIDNPFGEGKLYRTGDLARWLPDGNIEYLGRIDEQVKIRGFRIELGEIESVLRTLNEIKDCAVIARNDASGEKAIYAYLVSDEEISLSAVRDRLSASLPEYMIPSYMGQIDMIPVNANGKLDRKALPELEATSTREYVAPRNETE
ncbi:MAG: amino acid adenylation domain-containing protein, partial [Clostridia bacterium]|nr:amino acid adenylation domain-containing protein [Clostridia bacterium]